MDLPSFTDSFPYWWRFDPFSVFYSLKSFSEWPWVSFYILANKSLGQSPRNGIAASKGQCICHVVRYCQVLFHWDCSWGLSLSSLSSLLLLPHALPRSTAQWPRPPEWPVSRDKLKKREPQRVHTMACQEGLWSGGIWNAGAFLNPTCPRLLGVHKPLWSISELGDFLTTTLITW